jgi:hypothetical protein
VQLCLTFMVLVLAADEFHHGSAGAAGSGPENLHLIPYGVVILSLVGGIAFVVPKIRHMRRASRPLRNVRQDVGREDDVGD